MLADTFPLHQIKAMRWFPHGAPRKNISGFYLSEDHTGHLYVGLVPYPSRFSDSGAIVIKPIIRVPATSRKV